MNSYVIIQTADVELLSVRVLYDKGRAEELFMDICDEHNLLEDDIDQEIEGTIRIAGDSTHCVQLVEKEVE